MFIDGIHHNDEQFSNDAKALSKSFLAIMKHYQNRRPTPELIGDTPVSSDVVRVQAGAVTVHCILAAEAFAIGILIKDLDRRERRKLREYLVTKLDEVLREHGA
jgi:hypothetical protein